MGWRIWHIWADMGFGLVLGLRRSLNELRGARIDGWIERCSFFLFPLITLITRPFPHPRELGVDGIVWMVLGPATYYNLSRTLIRSLSTPIAVTSAPALLTHRNTY